MFTSKRSPQQRARLSTLSCLFVIGVLLGGPPAARAGCGCDKPPPVPAAVIPSAAFPGMMVTLFDSPSGSKFKLGDQWNVVFQSGTATATVEGVVEAKRVLTDPTGKTVAPQLVISVPDLPVGPATIQASTTTASLVVPEFTIIGKPVMISEQNGVALTENYTTAVGADGALYISVGGLNQVCKPMGFTTFLTSYPLRLDGGSVVITNAQGFLIDSLGTQSGYLSVLHQPNGTTSDTLYYYRHSFAQYCLDHHPGGPKEVNPNDPNWHLDGTPHTDYSTLIFAITGHFDDGTVPPAGSTLTFELEYMRGKVYKTDTMPWHYEKQEEH